MLNLPYSSSKNVKRSRQTMFAALNHPLTIQELFEELTNHLRAWGLHEGRYRIKGKLETNENINDNTTFSF